MNTTRAACVALTAVLPLACAEPEPHVEIGTTAICCCDGEYPAQYLKSSSRRVPLNQPPWEGFGFFIRFPSTAPRTVTVTHQLPGVPEKLGESWHDLGYEPADAVDGLTAAPVEVRGGRWFSFGTEVGDPVGIYRYRIAIDGSDWETVEFEVIPGGSPVTEPGEIPACPNDIVFEAQ